MTNTATPEHKNPCRRGHEIYRFGRPSIAHHYYIISFSDLYTGVEKKTLDEKYRFSKTETLLKLYGNLELKFPV